MATNKIKYTEKELKQPDEFNKTITRAIDFTSDHGKKILIVVSVVVVVLIAAFIISSSSEQQTLDANKSFDNAFALFEAGDNEGALKGFLATSEQYPDQAISNIALYYAALVNFNDEKYDESVTLLNRFDANESSEPMLVESATLTMGLAYFNQNEWQKAIDYLSKITDPTSPYEHQAKLYTALSYEKLGDPARANSIYEQMNQTQTGINPGTSTVRQVPPN